jgi:hypothetical protein
MERQGKYVSKRPFRIQKAILKKWVFCYTPFRFNEFLGKNVRKIAVLM